MGYEDTAGVILYWKPDKNFVIHRYHHVWFDEYNSSLCIEDNNNTSYLLIKQDPDSLIHNSDLLN